jgi:hypothetical protein
VVLVDHSELVGFKPHAAFTEAPIQAETRRSLFPTMLCRRRCCRPWSRSGGGRS